MLRKTGWLLLALLAPEIVAYTAWYQRGTALIIMRHVNLTYGYEDPLPWYQRQSRRLATAFRKSRQLLHSSEVVATRQPTFESQRPVTTPNDDQALASEPNLQLDSNDTEVSTPQGRRHPWTITHGFYAVMGGFAVNATDTVSLSHKSSSATLDRFWFLGVRGLRLLMKLNPDELPNLSAAEIESKSKANALAKTLVCVQALWFLAQTLSRLFQQIPISLLELNTSGHALCALLIYLLWWEKPFDVEYPTILQSQIVQQLHAYKCMQDHPTATVTSIRRQIRDLIQNDSIFRPLSKEQRRSILQYPEVEADIISLSYYDFENTETMMTETRDPTACNGDADGNRPFSQESTTDTLEDNSAESVTLALGDTLPGTILSFRPAFSRGGRRSGLHFYGPKMSMLQRRFDYLTDTCLFQSKIILSAQDVSRWRSTSKLIECCKAKHPMTVNPQRPLRRTLCDSGLLVDYSGEFPDLSSIVKDFTVMTGFSTAALVYGGLHALAWNAHFDPPFERLLWQMSSCIVMIGIPVYAALLKSINYLDNFNIQPRKSRTHKVLTIAESLLILLLILILIAYVLARGYLVVECFINLFNLPEEVYDVPQWSAYFPHIS